MKLSGQGLWVSRGGLARARLQARARQHDFIDLDVTEENRYRDPAARATLGFAADWAVVREQLPPGHARRTVLNQLVSEASATHVRQGVRKQLSPLWAPMPIASAEGCWAGYAADFEVTWYDDPIYPVVTFLTLTSGH